MDWNPLANLDPSVIELLKKSKEILSLREYISPDELFNLMDQDRSRFPGEFKLKKGLFGTSIVFDKYMGFGTTIKVKESMIIIKRISPSSNNRNHKNQSISHLVEIVDSSQNVIDAVTTGKVSDDLLGGPNYFKNICEVMRELLQSRVQSL